MFRNSIGKQSKKTILTIIKRLIKSDTGLSIEKDNNNICDILKSYDVGTEQSRNVLLPTNTVYTTRLGPLRKLNFSSTIEKANIAINNISEDVNQENIITNNNINARRTILSKETYQKICNLINVMIAVHKVNSNYECIKTFLGFKLLEHRSEKYYFGTPRVDLNLKRHGKKQ